MIYRLYTEDKNRAKICDFVGQLFPGFTVFKAFGYWEGIKEESLVIEIYDKSPDAVDKVREVAERIKIYNAQACVMVSQSKAKVEFI